MNTSLNSTFGSIDADRFDRNMTNSLPGVKALTDMLYVVLVYTLLSDRGFRFNNPCVGVLLRADLVLTTLSCLEVSFHGGIDIGLVFVYLRNNQVLKSERVFVYPDAEDADGPNVALILCETSRVRDFPRLPEKEFRIGDYEYCELCGYGKDVQTITLENFTPMRINRTDMEECSEPGHSPDYFCLHFADAQPCRGDVGAPLVCGGAVHAIFNPPVARWSSPSCQDDYGATFTRLYPAVRWIRTVNSTLAQPLLNAINTPWYWVGLGVTVLTIIVVIYYALMKYVDWMCDQQQDVVGEGADGRVVFVRGSEISRISRTSRMTVVSTRWQWPHGANEKWRNIT